MKLTTCLLTAPLCLSVLGPILILASASVAATSSLVIFAGVSAIVVSDYGHSTVPDYAQATAAQKPSIERLPLAA